MRKQSIRISVMLKIMKIFRGEKILYSQMQNFRILGKRLK
nr:MAG TPA: hypothetical protein [Bacteriophage sp.]